VVAFTKCSPLLSCSLRKTCRNARKYGNNSETIGNKKDLFLQKVICLDDSYINAFENGGGGIRTHGTLADTLVFKASMYLVIAVGLRVFKETIKPFVHHFGKLRCFSRNVPIS